MKKLLGWIGVVATVLALATLGLVTPKLVALLLTLAFLSDPLIQIIVAVLLAFSGVTGLTA